MKARELKKLNERINKVKNGKSIIEQAAYDYLMDLKNNNIPLTNHKDKTNKIKFV